MNASLHLYMSHRVEATSMSSEVIESTTTVMKSFAKEVLEEFTTDLINTGIVTDETKLEYWKEKHLARLEE